MTHTLVNLQKFVLPYAFSAALVRILIDFFSRINSDFPLGYYFSFLICFILEIGLIVFLIKKYKTQNDNQLTLKEGLKIGLIVMLILGLGYSTFSYIYDVYIDPDFQQNTLIAIRKAYNPPALKEINLENNVPDVFSIFGSTVKLVIVGFFISLVSSSFLKSK